jgi:hypothetical protein
MATGALLNEQLAGRTVALLHTLGCPVERLSTDAVEWLLQDESNAAMFAWMCDNLGEANLLTDGELAQCVARRAGGPRVPDARVCRYKVLEDQQLLLFDQELDEAYLAMAAGEERESPEKLRCEPWRLPSLTACLPACLSLTRL